MASTNPLIMIIVGILIVLVTTVAIFVFKKKQDEFKRTGKYHKGHYTGLGMVFGMMLGVSLGAALNEPYTGLKIGFPVGLALGALWEKKNADKIRPFTKEEEELQKKVLWIVLALLALGIASFVLLIK